MIRADVASQNGDLASLQLIEQCMLTAIHQPYSVWNFANAHTLVIVTANVSPGTSDQAGGNDQIVDLEIIDGSHAGSKYLSKKVSSSALELFLLSALNT